MNPIHPAIPSDAPVSTAPVNEAERQAIEQDAMARMAKRIKPTKGAFGGRRERARLLEEVRNMLTASRNLNKALIAHFCLDEKETEQILRNFLVKKLYESEQEE